jgi:hypothetical protein
VIFCNKLIFYSEEILVAYPTQILEDHPLSAVRDCLLSIPHLEAVSSICNLRPRRAVVTRDPLKYQKNKI